ESAVSCGGERRPLARKGTGVSSRLSRARSLSGGNALVWADPRTGSGTAHAPLISRERGRKEGGFHGGAGFFGVPSPSERRRKDGIRPHHGARFRAKNGFLFSAFGGGSCSRVFGGLLQTVDVSARGSPARSTGWSSRSRAGERNRFSF